MKARETLLSLFLTMALTRMAYSIAELIIKDELYLQSVLFALFFTLFRIKYFLDDLDHSTYIEKKINNIRYHDERHRIRYKYVCEFVIGIFTWSLWVISSFIISNNKYYFCACFILIISFIISSLELYFVSTMKPSNKHSYIIYNLVYIICLTIATIDSFHSKHPPSSSTITLALVTLLLFVINECYKSRKEYIRILTSDFMRKS